ncbi:MAG TPA: serine hydrolase domain-containing protein, partial [Acidimicrobiales bacterium]|nr:serine hydrolase domain-containing protein [Acidimicrobiales bacterium]
MTSALPQPYLQVPCPVCPARGRSPRLLAALAAVATAMVGLSAVPACASASQPGFQGILNGLVTGPQRVAPGATAFVVTPQGMWAGAAGTADVKTGRAMWPDARMRIQSNSKAWLMAVIFQLADEGKLALSDTVPRWLPGLLPYGNQITIDELISDTSGLIDDNDMEKSRAAWEHALANV